MKLQIHAPPQLKAYLMQPYDIAKFQCLVHAKNRRIETTKKTIDYYGLDISGEATKNALAKGDVIEVLSSKPSSVIKQLGFYFKCKGLALGKEDYDYLQQLAESIAEVSNTSSMAKPAIDEMSSNCKIVEIPWSVCFDTKVIKGSSKCLIAKRSIEASATLLYEQSKEAMLAARRRLMDKYPIMFVLGKECKVPVDRFDAPVRVENKLVNFTTLEHKSDYKVSFDKHFEKCYENRRETKRRRVVLEPHGEDYRIERIESPSHL